MTNWHVWPIWRGVGVVVQSELLRSSYPGLNPQSTDLWRQWLKYYETSFDSFQYNVRVGQGITPPAYLSDQEKELWKKLTQKRVDVIAHRANQTWIIEIQERADLRTLPVGGIPSPGACLYRDERGLDAGFDLCSAWPRYGSDVER